MEVKGLIAIPGPGAHPRPSPAARGKPPDLRQRRGAEVGVERPGWGTPVAKKRPATSKCLRGAAERGVPGATGRGPKTPTKTSPRRVRVYGRAGELVFDKGFDQAL